MKKIFLNMGLMLLSCMAVFGQIDVEKQMNIKQFNPALAERTPNGNVDCGCKNNILLDGGFQKLTDDPGSANISASSTPWKLGTNTPQWSSTAVPFACESGVVSMWGNKTVGESIYQSGLALTPGSYTVKFTAKFANPTGISTFVRLKIWLFSGSSPSSYDGTGIANPVNITSTGWATYTMSITVLSGQTGIVLHPENDYSKNDGNYVSWIQLDNICIEKTCQIPDEKCNPQFTAAPFTVNSQGNVVINVNPVVTSGAQHYWGLNVATGIGDNAPIPLATILSGGSFGLGISNIGTQTPIGMGTGITGSTSGYGYHYEGVDVSRCFKITHYIKCCGKWYSQTNTYCTKLCVEAKESGLMEADAKDVEKAMAIEAGKGRG